MNTLFSKGMVPMPEYKVSKLGTGFLGADTLHWFVVLYQQFHSRKQERDSLKVSISSNSKGLKTAPFCAAV